MKDGRIDEYLAKDPMGRQRFVPTRYPILPAPCPLSLPAHAPRPTARLPDCQKQPGQTRAPDRPECQTPRQTDRQTRQSRADRQNKSSQGETRQPEKEKQREEIMLVGGRSHRERPVLHPQFYNHTPLTPPLQHHTHPFTLTPTTPTTSPTTHTLIPHTHTWNMYST